MTRIARMTTAVLLGAMMIASTGCRYTTNRYYDFRDTFILGAGVTAENEVTGMWPPSLGLLVEVTDFLSLGAITHNGYTAELDLRGTYVGPESTTRAGFLWWQLLRKYQSYENATYMNAFKDETFPWNVRMASPPMDFMGRPAKRLHYQHWSMNTISGSALLHRGWQYWGYSGFEAAICDPLFTHLGLMLKAGIDISEVSDLLLGVVGIDFKRDDMTNDEYMMLRDCDLGAWQVMGIDVVPARPR